MFPKSSKDASSSGARYLELRVFGVAKACISVIPSDLQLAVERHQEKYTCGIFAEFP